jgi:hypothetical protein
MDMGFNQKPIDLVVDEICAFPWTSLSSDDMVDVAWAYYFFSIQFRESLGEARRLYPTDVSLQKIEAEECDTSNLSPWPGVAAVGERMNHDEFMRRTLALMSFAPARVATHEAIGRRYLAATHALDPEIRAASLVSYEDGGLERVFRSILTFTQWDSDLLRAFRHFLSEHVRFDSDSEQGHGALCRHLAYDDRILPLWQGFRDLLLQAVPALASRAWLPVAGVPSERIPETADAKSSRKLTNQVGADF